MSSFESGIFNLEIEKVIKNRDNEHLKKICWCLSIKSYNKFVDFHKIKKHNIPHSIKYARIWVFTDTYSPI